MDISKIRDIIEDVDVSSLGIKEEYSVLIPLIEIDDELNIIYELRSKKMGTQPGEVSFPGGGREGNESYLDTAIRETCEELNINRENIEVFGEIDSLVSMVGIKIHCFVGQIVGLNIEDIKPNENEVDHIFTIPLDFFYDNEPRIYNINFKKNLDDDFPFDLIPNGKDYNWRETKDSEVFYNHPIYNLWGFTARMTHNFINILKNNY